MAERIIQNKPDWITIHDVEGEVGQGQEYWYLARFQYKPDTESGGKHHIYIEQPHDPQVFLIAHNEVEQFRIALDKPANEPGGNCHMNGGRHYTARLDGLASDWVDGMHMPGNHHVTYHLWYEKRRKGIGPDGPAPTGDEAALFEQLQSQVPPRRTLSLNPNAGIQRRIVADGFLPVSSEVGVAVAGRGYTAQLADATTPNRRTRIYFVSNDNFGNVRFIEL